MGHTSRCGAWGGTNYDLSYSVMSMSLLVEKWCLARVQVGYVYRSTSDGEVRWRDQRRYVCVRNRETR